MANRLNPDSNDVKTNPNNLESESDNSQIKKSGNQNNTSLKIIIGIAGIFAGICGLVVLGALFYIFARSYSEPKVTIILEPDYSLVSTVDRSDLETAARILTERCRALGCGTSFTVTENNQIIAKVPTSFDIETFAMDVTATGLLEFVDFGETLLPERTVVATDFGYKSPSQSDATVWHTVLTNNEIESVDVTQNQFGGYEISLVFTPDGTRIFSDYTTNNVGKYLGIVLDKVVISAPRVNSPITDGVGVISGNFAKEQAESLALYLKPDGVLPIPLRVKSIE